MLKTSTKTIGGYTYRVTQLDAVRGRRALGRLGRVIGSAFEALQGKADEEGLTSALGKLLSGLSDADVDYFCDLFSACTSVSGGSFGDGLEPQLESVFATHFAGRYGEMLQWLIFCLQANFGSFFGEAAKLMASKSAAAERASS
jgi:hypothetical protein